MYPGLPHGYLSFSGLKSAQKGGIDSVKAVGCLLQKDDLDEAKLHILEQFPFRV